MRTSLGLPIVALAVALMQPAAAGTGPVVYAHRGGAGLAPENTMGAFRHAHTLFGGRGVWLEMDTQLTADGVLVIIHDDTLDRTTDCTGAVIEHTAAEVTACDASGVMPSWPDAEPVPTTEEVFVEGRDAGWRVMIEIKDIPGEANFDPAGTAAAEALVGLVASTGFPRERLLVQSFWPPALDHVKRLDPAIRTALLTTSRLHDALPPGGGFTALENAAYATVRDYDVTAPDHRSPDLSPETVAAIRALGLEVVVWTVNEPSDITRAIGLGVDGIISDRPDLVYAAL